MRNIFDYKDNLCEKDDIPAILKWGNLDGPIPDVSILMPVYNHPHFFKLALETAINQDYQGAYEIVVLDNNKDDDINNINEFENYIIKKNCSKILYYKNTHNIDGINSYNRLPQLSRADYFTFLHDDDELESNCLSELMRIKKEKGLSKELIVPSLIIIDGKSNVIYKPRKINSGTIWRRNYRMSMYDWFLKNHTNGCATLQNRECFINLGGYCREFIPTADYAFYILYVHKYGGVFVNTPLLRYRVAENDSLEVYEESIEMTYNIRNNILSKIKLPDKLLRRISEARRNVDLERNDQLFNGKLRRKAKLSDKIVLTIAFVFNMLRHT